MSPPAVLATCQGYGGEEMCLEISGEIPTLSVWGVVFFLLCPNPKSFYSGKRCLDFASGRGTPWLCDAPSSARV